MLVAQPVTSKAVSLFNGSDDKRMREKITLDSGSSADLFCNKHMVTDLRRVEDPMELDTNGGMILQDKKAMVPGYKEVWFNDKQPSHLPPPPTTAPDDTVRCAAFTFC